MAVARLDLGVKLLKNAKPINATRHLGTTFFDGASDNYSRLSSEDRARACFIQGHVEIWHGGDDEVATAILSRGMAEDGEHAALCAAYLQSIGRASNGSKSTENRSTERRGASRRSGGRGSWEWNFVEATAHYRKVRDEPNYNILTEKGDRESAIYPKERQASAALHRTLEALEKLPRSLDPVAQGALFYYVRNAQRQAWPEQNGGAQALTHRGKLEALPLDAEAATLRDFFLLEGDVGPLEISPIRLMAPNDVRAYASIVRKLSKSSLSEGLKLRLQRLEDKLQF